MKNKKLPITIICIVVGLLLLVVTNRLSGDKLYTETTSLPQSSPTTQSFDLASVPKFSKQPYVTLNNNIPEFDKGDVTATSYETYGALDELGRCTVCTACIGEDLMPTEKRESISAVKPTGWQSARYSFVDGGSLYNRCHLIGYQLTGENANKQNLITGTRYLNTEGMLPFENEVANYIKLTGNHVLYRVTPIFKGKELVARGVQMEGLSVEDNGKGVSFNVYCYNNQPGVTIDYKTGNSKETGAATKANDRGTFIINLNNKKFHKPDCDSVKQMSDSNKKSFTGSRQDLIDSGYTPCGSCSP